MAFVPGRWEHINMSSRAEIRGFKPGVPSGPPAGGSSKVLDFFTLCSIFVSPARGTRDEIRFCAPRTPIHPSVPISEGKPSSPSPTGCCLLCVPAAPRTCPPPDTAQPTCAVCMQPCENVLDFHCPVCQLRATCDFGELGTWLAQMETCCKCKYIPYLKGCVPTTKRKIAH